MSSPQETPEIPVEIADTIVDLLHDDHKTLLAVSRVSQVWYPRTRKYLLRRLALGKRPGLVGRYSNLRDLLVSRPDFCEYVQELSITFGDPASNHDITSPDFLPILIPLLTSVKRLEISGEASSDLYWFKLPVQVQTALSEVMTRTSTTAVALKNVRECPLDMLGSSAYIRQLSLIKVTPVGGEVPFWKWGTFPDPWSDPDPLSEAEVEMLATGEETVLEIEESADAMAAILLAATRSGNLPPFLRTKVLRVGNDNDRRFLCRWGSFIHCWIHSLTVLRISAGVNATRFVEYIECFRNLRHLSFTLPSHDLGLTHNGLSLFGTMLTAGVNPNGLPAALETLEVGFELLDFDGNHKRCLTWVQSLMGLDIWFVMDRYGDSALFSALKLVRVEIPSSELTESVLEESDFDWSLSAQNLRNQMSALDTRGILQVELVDRTTGIVLRNLNSPTKPSCVQEVPGSSSWHTKVSRYIKGKAKALKPRKGQ